MSERASFRWSPAPRTRLWDGWLSRHLLTPTDSGLPRPMLRASALISAGDGFKCFSGVIRVERDGRGPADRVVPRA